jgi:hypothetical protein
MRYRSILLSCLPLLVPLPALADTCNPGEAVLFTCSTESHKRLTLCESKATIVYAFGKEGLRPDIVVTVPRNKASTWQWKGIGRYVNYSVEVPNGGITYRVYSSIDRNVGEATYEAGVEILQKEESLATVLCQETTVIDHLEGVDLPLLE